MSARNGDKSRFNRVRKQKIARRKRTDELLVRGLLVRGAKATKPEGASTRVQPRSVPA
jgi:hypothetical protein